MAISTVTSLPHQLGITISSIGLGWIGEPALATLLDPLFEQILPESLAFVSAHGVAFAIAFTIITVLHVVFGELAPKSVALQYPEQTSMAVAAPVRYFLIGLRPAIVTMNGFGRWVLKIAGSREVDPHQQVYTAEELEDHRHGQHRRRRTGRHGGRDHSPGTDLRRPDSGRRDGPENRGRDIAGRRQPRRSPGRD
ncbi:MAG: CNNM domain-containing protein [Thermomicrobiales bacterium]